MGKAVLAQKKADVEALTKKMQDAKTIVAFDYIGLTVEQFTSLRRQLREAGCEVQVIKNNISRRASEAAGYSDLAQYFKGPKAVAFSNGDVVAPAKIIYEFSKKNEVVKIQAGVVEGKVENDKGMIGLATLPSRETLLTMLAMGMLKPLTDLAVGLNMLTEKEEAN